eukprot:11224774-Lingulodinium_polyedra.AAC.1
MRGHNQKDALRGHEPRTAEHRGLETIVHLRGLGNEGPARAVQHGRGVDPDVLVLAPDVAGLRNRG